MAVTNVTQEMVVRVVPVNQPLEHNKYGEQQGYYNAFIAFDSMSAPAKYKLEMAEQEWMRGIVHSDAGYGSAGTPEMAVAIALTDFQKKFGKICVSDPENIVW